MITEKAFALSHGSFWQNAIPLVSAYLRRRNLALERFTAPLESILPNDRGLINEAAFRLYCAARERRVHAARLSKEDKKEAVVRAESFIERFREPPSYPREKLSKEGLREAVVLAERLREFTEARGPARVITSPSFRGCGWVDGCSGDLLLDTNLCEVKAGDTAFRGIDVKQILVYAALNFVSRQYKIDEICLVNPRRGVFLRERLDRLSLSIAGVPAGQLLGEIVEYIQYREWREESV